MRGIEPEAPGTYPEKSLKPQGSATVLDWLRWFLWVREGCPRGDAR